MAASVNTVWTRNPSGLVSATYGHTHIERAPDAAGAPGVFAEIASITIDPSDEFTAYVDLSGDSASWYRYRWSNVADTVFSGYQADVAQPGTNRVKTWVMNNIKDAAILAPLWDQWIEECLVALMAFGIWKLDYADVVPTTTSGVVNTTYGLAAKLRDVIRVDMLSTATGTPRLITLLNGEYEQQNRNIWIKDAATSYTYRVWGKAQYSAVGEMTDDYFELLHEMLRVKYFEYRANGRGNYRAYIVLDRLSDITPADLLRFAQQAQQKVDRMTAALSNGEPAIPAPDHGYAGYA